MSDMQEFMELVRKYHNDLSPEAQTVAYRIEATDLKLRYLLTKFPVNDQTYFGKWLDYLETMNRVRSTYVSSVESALDQLEANLNEGNE